MRQTNYSFWIELFGKIQRKNGYTYERADIYVIAAVSHMKNFLIYLFHLFKQSDDVRHKISTFSTSNLISLYMLYIGCILKLMKTMKRRNKTKQNEQHTAKRESLFTHISTQIFRFQYSKVRIYLCCLFLLSLSLSLSCDKFLQKRTISLPFLLFLLRFFVFVEREKHITMYA